MQLTSPDFINGGKIPERFTCDGEQTSPELDINDIPEETKSLALVLEDPDAPSGTFTHWVLWNIPITDKIMAGTIPVGAVEGLNSGGSNSYLGPCPPKGTHNYTFTLYALDNKLEGLDESKTDGNSLLDIMTGHIITTAELTGAYSRKENR